MISSDFDSRIFECVDNALSTLGKDQKELVRLRLKNRHYLPLKNVAHAPITFEQSLIESLGISVSTSVKFHILENISRTFRVHIGADSDLSFAIDAARRVTRISTRKEGKRSSLPTESKRRSIRLTFRV